MGTFEDVTNQQVSDVFLNTDFGPAVVVDLYPKGVIADRENLTAIVIEDHLTGSNETRGDGVVNNRKEGSTIRDSVVLEVSDDANIQDVQPRQKVDMIKIEGRLYKAVRILGRDSGMKAVLFAHVNDVVKNSSTLQG